MMEETGNFSSGCPGLYTQIFRIWAGSCSGAYTVYSIFQGPGRFLLDSVYRKLENTGPRAKSVYSNFLDPGRLLVWGVYRKFEKPGFRQNQYTQIFWAQAGSWSGAYTRYSKNWARAKSVYSKIKGPGRFLIDSVYSKLEKSELPGEICILKFS